MNKNIEYKKKEDGFFFADINKYSNFVPDLVR